MTLPYLQAPTPMAFAHRGGSTAAPENTAAAFQHAWEIGYRHFETDVHLTSDGVLVAFHDDDLTRVAGVEGTIASSTAAELGALDLGDGHRIPTLEELLGTFPDAAFNIDPKADDAVVPLADVLKRLDVIDRVGIGSFDDDRISELQRRLGPGLCTSPGPTELLTFLASDPRPEAAFASHGCLQVPPAFGSIELTAALVDEAHDLGLQVHVWTINDEQEMHQLLDRGVDAIMTDETELLKHVLQQRNQWNGA